MELELHQETFACYRAAAPIPTTDEETAETIVPDYSPDIARIVETNACLFLRNQTPAEGRLVLSGSVRITLLYMTEDTKALRSLEYSIPYEHSEALPEGCEQAAAEGTVCTVEARLLNPRKLFTKVNIAWRITPYCKAALTTCGEITEREKYAIQTLCEQQRVSLIRFAGGREFVFAEELDIPGGREGVQELLSAPVTLRVTEAKCIGSKVILKGVACVTCLYTAESGKLCAYSEELPFSQVLDAGGEENREATVSAVLNLSGSEIHADGSENRTISVKLFLNAFLVLRSSESVCCITDLYSTACALDAKLEPVTLWQEPKVTGVVQNVREQLDTASEVKCVLYTDICFDGVSTRPEGDKSLLRTTARVSVLYLDESDTPLSLRRQVDITAEAPAWDDAQLSVESVCAGDVTASVNDRGLELRFPVEFTLVAAPAPAVPCLVSLSTGEACADAPSIVLRSLHEGESLWNVAKQYRTTIEDILSANEIAENAVVEAGQMLLIPGKR